MNITRTVVVGVTGGALAAWFAAASTSGPRQVSTSVPVRNVAVEKSGAELAEEIGRLHERLRPTDAPDRAARDLFEFAARSAPARTVRHVEATPVTDTVAAPAPFPFSLIGIAEDGGVRSAILSGAGQVSIVKQGDRVGASYTVTRIDPSTVELADAAHASSDHPDGDPVRLALK